MRFRGGNSFDFYDTKLECFICLTFAMGKIIKKFTQSLISLMSERLVNTPRPNCSSN